MEDEPKRKAYSPGLLKMLEKPGRLLSDKDQQQFVELIQSGLSEVEAATLIGKSWTGYRRQFASLANKARLDMRLECFRALKQHINNNAPAAIFAAKAKLGWQDKQEAEQNQAVEYVDLPDNEGREAWAKRQGKLGRSS